MVIYGVVVGGGHTQERDNFEFAFNVIIPPIKKIEEPGEVGWGIKVLQDQCLQDMGVVRHSIGQLNRNRVQGVAHFLLKNFVAALTPKLEATITPKLY